MEKQGTFADFEYNNKKKKTQKEKFLGEMDEILTWSSNSVHPS